DLQGHLDADDVIQEAHARAFQSASNFEPRGIGPFVRWVKTIALNRLRNLIQFHRAQKRGGSGRQVVASPLHDSALFLLETIDAVERTPSRSVARLEAIEAVRYAMDHLTDEHARAVELVYLRGLTVAAAAGYMNRSERAVHNLCYDAKQRLRNLLGSRSRYLTGN
ncbi:MAG: RNA polymerase sigma factor, partial [Phycisphaerae bacterium]